MTNGNDAAFHNFNLPDSNKGLTKREYFAAMAMSGLMMTPAMIAPQERPLDVAKKAVQHADALIAALNKKDGE